MLCPFLSSLRSVSEITAWLLVASAPLSRTTQSNRGQRKSVKGRRAGRFAAGLLRVNPGCQDSPESTVLRLLSLSVSLSRRYNLRGQYGHHDQLSRCTVQMSEPILYVNAVRKTPEVYSDLILRKPTKVAVQITFDLCCDKSSPFGRSATLSS